MSKGVDAWVTTDLERLVNGIMCSANEKSMHHQGCGECTFKCAKWLGYDVKPLVKTVRKVLDDWEQRRCE